MRSLSTVKNDMERINSRYNPENDLIPGGPLVTWAELRCAVITLLEEVEELTERIDELEYEKRDRDNINRYIPKG